MALVPTAVNGRIPEGLLGTLPGFDGDGTPHRADLLAVAAFERMAAAFTTAGLGVLAPTPGFSCYRTLADQAHMRAIGLTTIPVGRSIHGEAKAVDLYQVPFGSARHNWLKANAARFGWYQPTWAQKGAVLPEPWHWEYDHQLDQSTPDAGPAPKPTTPPLVLEDDTMRLIRTPDMVIWVVSTYNVEPIPDVPTANALAVIWGTWVEVSAATYDLIRAQVVRNIEAYSKSLKGQGL